MAKATLLIAFGLLVLAILSIIVVYGVSEWRLSQTYVVPSDALAMPDGPGDVQRGEHIVRAISVCVDCHGRDLGGRRVENVPLLASVVGPNITTGEGGVGEASDAVLAGNIRHGVDRANRPLIVMPSQNFYHMSDEDLAAVIAYLREAPAVDSTLDQGDPGLLIRGPMALGMSGLLPASEIDHEGPRPEAPPAEGPTAGYGEYLVSMGGCRDCHSRELSGGRTPGFGPEAPDLTRTGAAGRWELQDFLTAMRFGRTPEAGEIDAVMPWRFYAGMTDTELTAIYEYLQNLPEE